MYYAIWFNLNGVEAVEVVLAADLAEAEATARALVNALGVDVTRIVCVSDEAQPEAR